MALEFFCKLNGKEFGPLSEKKLKSLVSSGKLKPNDLIRPSNSTIWIKAKNILTIKEEEADEEEEKGEEEEAESEGDQPSDSRKPVQLITKPSFVPDIGFQEDAPDYFFVQILAIVYMIAGAVCIGLAILSLIGLIMNLSSNQANRDNLILIFIVTAVCSTLAGITCFAFGQLLNMATKSAKNLHMILKYISKSSQK